MHSPSNSSSALAVNLVCLAVLAVSAIGIRQHGSVGDAFTANGEEQSPSDVFWATKVSNWVDDTVATETLLSRARSVRLVEGDFEQAKDMYRRVQDQYWYLDQAETAAEELALVEWLEETPVMSKGPSPPIENDQLPEIDAVRRPPPVE